MDTIEGLLAEVPTAVLGRHLSWIVSQSHQVPQVSPRRTLLVDQAQILIDVLDRRGHYEVVARALREPWGDADGSSERGSGGGDGGEGEGADADVAAYAGRLARSTVGQPEFSPYVSLARSASRFAASALGAREAEVPGMAGPAAVGR